MSQSSPLTHQDANHRDSAWERAANYEKEERPIHPVSKIVIKGRLMLCSFARHQRTWSWQGKTWKPFVTSRPASRVTS